jgi:hypothetical protein
MKVEPQYFGMFTPEGNALVEKLVEIALVKGWDWNRTYRELETMASINPQVYGEATDTAVRERVYDACGFKTEFYIL